MTWLLRIAMVAFMQYAAGEREEAVTTAIKMKSATKRLVDNLIVDLAQLRRENAELTMKAELLANEVRRLAPAEKPPAPKVTDSQRERHEDVKSKNAHRGDDLNQLMVHESEGKKAINEAMKNELLDRHNAFRCMHEATPMVWDDSIAQNAQSWATEVEGEMNHSPEDKRKNVNGISYLGENLAWGAMGGEAVDMWYDEVDCTHPRGKVTYFNEGSCDTGHYTQLVWKSSTKLGCGVHGKLTVCQYGPGGNYQGRFEDEVLTPKRDAVECGAPVTPDGISAYISTLLGKSSVDCNTACKADGQSSMTSMDAIGNGQQTTWTCGCNKGDGVKIQCSPGWGELFQSCNKV